MRDDVRQPGPLIVGGVLVSFLLLQIALVVLAGRNFEGPDDPAYYKMGLTYDRQMAPRRQGWRVVGNLPGELSSGQPFRLQARVLDPSGQESSLPVVAHFGRPATRSQDFELALPGSWSPVPGWWDVTYRVQGQPLGKSRVYVR